jgi:hypothetical protein
MKTLMCIIASLLFLLASATEGMADDNGWPRRRVVKGNTLITYQPQVDEWKEFRDVDWRMAVSVTPAGGKQALGVVELHGRTSVENDLVTIDALEIKNVHFPSLDEATASKMDRLLRTFLPPSVTITLQQFIACVPKAGSVSGVQLRNDPPTIFVSESPAILLDLVPEAVRAPIKDTVLEYVVNTDWRLFFDRSTSQYFLLVGTQWLQAADLAGPWSAAKQLPMDMQKLQKNAKWADLKGFIPPPAKRGPAVPTVLYSISPAEVILFDGKPVYAKVPGTGLQYATNTTSYVFLHSSTNTYYYLTAGRWFRAGSLNGPWTYATPDLPADFALIPGNSPAAQVRASVPGTEEAMDAVLLAQIPVTATVNPAAAAARVKVTYDGDPQFASLDGTTLTYAKNTPYKVIKVGDVYYLCFQGVWFMSTTPQGPWQTAPSVPADISTIPPSSPLYNVTYVTQVTNPDGSVTCTYTSGYTGAYVMSTTSTVVIVSGTGYYYPAYVGMYPVYGYPVYYPHPYTYGPATYYRSPTGAYGVSQTAYGPYGSVTARSSYNPYTGTYARSSTVTTASGRSTYGQAYNPYTGAYGTTSQGSNAYSQWGSSTVAKGGESVSTQHYTDSRGTVGSAQSSAGGQVVGKMSASGSTAVGKTSGGDVYAGHDGNVYKNTGSGWQKYDNGNWSSVKPGNSGFTQQQSSQQTQQRGSSVGGQGGSERTERLQQEAQNRQRGAEQSQRSQQFQRGREGGGYEGRSGYGGASREGGGRGRR